MDRAKLRTAIERIRSVIQEELESHRGSSLEDNYATGIRICDELLADVADDGLVFTESSLLGRFDRYVVDSLPWTGRILEVIDEERRVAKACFK